MSTDLAACFRAHYPTVCRWAYALTGRYDEAQDVAQEVFSRMASDPPRFAHEAAARGWLRRVTSRIVVDRWRSERARRNREHAVPSFEPSADERIAAMETGGRLRAALACLSDQQRLVVMGKCFDGLTFAAIAAEAGLAVGTVKTHYVRALEALRNLLGRDASVGSFP